MNKISIVMPAYNEEKRIGKTLEAYSQYFEYIRSSKFDYQIIVVINNTTDNTPKIVESFSKINKRIKYLNIPERGKGNAVRVGFNKALKSDFNLIGFVDADLATAPDQFYRLVSCLSSKKVDGVIADRYLKSSKLYPPITFRRVIVSRIFNALIRALLQIPYRDTQCGAKVFRAKAIESSSRDWVFSGWAFDVDLLYALRKNGFRIISCPTVWVDKEFSKINFFSQGPWMALGILRIRLLNSPFKFLMRIYDNLLQKIWDLKNKLKARI